MLECERMLHLFEYRTARRCHVENGDILLGKLGNWLDNTVKQGLYKKLELWPFLAPRERPIQYETETSQIYMTIELFPLSTYCRLHFGETLIQTSPWWRKGVVGGLAPLWCLCPLLITLLYSILFLQSSYFQGAYIPIGKTITFLDNHNERYDWMPKGNQLGLTEQAWLD